MPIISELHNLYQCPETFGLPKDYYESLKYLCRPDHGPYLQSSRFLTGIEAMNKDIVKPGEIDTDIGDIRIDVPVWFGCPDNAELRIAVIGLEPRDTNMGFNLASSAFFNKNEQHKYVYATPYGIDHWNSDNQLFKAFNMYNYRNVFNDLIESRDLFVLFTDFVKKFDIFYKPGADISPKNAKISNQKCARKTFNEKAKESVSLVQNELSIIQADLIITLGKPSANAVSKYLQSEIPHLRFTHPAAYGNVKVNGKIVSAHTKKEFDKTIVNGLLDQKREGLKKWLEGQIEDHYLNG